MIQANELRLGNFIKYDDGTIVEVSTISGIDIGVKRFPQSLSTSVLLPIELTGQILVDCGLKKYSHEPGYTLGDDFEKSERCDEYSLGKISIMDWGNGFVLSNSFSFDLRVELKYLHQFQNVIFFITGKELNVQLSEPKVE